MAKWWCRFQSWCGIVPTHQPKTGNIKTSYISPFKSMKSENIGIYCYLKKHCKCVPRKSLLIRQVEMETSAIACSLHLYKHDLSAGGCSLNLYSSCGRLFLHLTIGVQTWVTAGTSIPLSASVLHPSYSRSLAPSLYSSWVINTFA